MNKYTKIIKNKYFVSLLVVVIIAFSFNIYTHYLFDQLNNETPREAIVEFIYGETHSWKSFFIEIEKDDYSNKEDNSLYYHIKYNGIYSIPDQMGGVIEVKKVDNHYYVIKYIGYC